MLSVKDVIKNSVYQSLGGGTGFSLENILLIFGISCLIGVYIYSVHKFMSKSAFYSKDLGVTMAGMPVVVAAIMIAMQSNLIVSLGMVGALSIVRFRNAVKNPLDLLYLFWTISAGIICGVGLSLLAIMLCVVMTIMIWVIQMLPDSKAPSLLILQIEEKNCNWEEIYSIIKKHSKYMKEKSKNISHGGIEAIFEVKTGQEDKLLEKLMEREELKQVHFLSHDGESRI